MAGSDFTKICILIRQWSFSVGESASGSHTYSWSPSTGTMYSYCSSMYSESIIYDNIYWNEVLQRMDVKDTDDVVVTVNTTSPTADAGKWILLRHVSYEVSKCR